MRREREREGREREGGREGGREGEGEGARGGGWFVLPLEDFFFSRGALIFCLEC